MTQNEIIEMALKEWRSGNQVKQAGLDRNYTNLFKTFAKLIAEKEREACAKICDEFCYGSTKILIERAIRARGQA
jgi:hypothetical protein